jgi:hypothetical protein
MMLDDHAIAPRKRVEPAAEGLARDPILADLEVDGLRQLRVQVRTDFQWQVHPGGQVICGDDTALGDGRNDIDARPIGGVHESPDELREVNRAEPSGAAVESRIVVSSVLVPVVPVVPAVPVVPVVNT